MNKQPKTVDQYFHRRALMMWTGFIGFILIYTVAASGIEFAGLSAFLALPKAIKWLLTNFWPSQRSLQYVFYIFKRLLQTVGLAIASTTIASVFAIFVAIIGSSVTGINKFWQYAARLVASVFRNIPIVAWAMVLLFSFKQNGFTGFMALFFITFGTLIRAFMETIEDETGETIKALQSVGASYLQVIFQGVLPMISASITSWILYMIENNVRDATLVGILTGTGVGFLFDLYYKSFRYDLAGMVTLQIVIVVVAIELISNKVRAMSL